MFSSIMNWICNGSYDNVSPGNGCVENGVEKDGSPNVMPGRLACWQKNVTLGTLEILKLNPLGDSGFNPVGIEIVISLQ